ncbi:response regulator [Spirosoma utsteinense]|uniref:CheY-like chemotaxis protein n=1 Tax=Spirosoma utsteinense TaxID=2585773 RepID=A0ABR6W9J8_9BACT|nr:response regulator [Spirosoma utsteinense]MBC3787641.1 CheY-like chemotaxis protein [Spirosoma utsteinense]MBC3793237.1 CheY-like chemotaxis protein [Spirosoma utsteinense]
MSLKGPIISIEDDEDDQYLIEQTIKELDIPNEIRFFLNGKEALTYLETTEEKPFLILCDVNMPVMNGLELRHHINDSVYLRQKSIPFIYLTTAANPQLIQAAYDATVQGFYKKASNYVGMREQIRLIVEYWQSCLHPNKEL